MYDDATMRLLGWPTATALQGMLLDAVRASDGSGATPRDMARKMPSVPLLLWMQAGAALHLAGKVAHGWRAVKGDGSAAQESCYTLPVQP